MFEQRSILSLNSPLIFIRQTKFYELMIEKAEKKDIPGLVKLINSAYRGDESRKGWTTEADIIEGELRTDESVLSAMLIRKVSVILKYILHDEICGCVHLEDQNGKLHLGMLSVSPSMQGKNIGKKLLSAAEEYALENNLTAIVMSVISLRHELIAWYEKHGYKKTGETKPFPSDDNKFGSPKQPLDFVIMEKSLERDPRSS
jgi:ribosomal protein S18 acetylase RimI-like enzyme